MAKTKHRTPKKGSPKLMGISKRRSPSKRKRNRNAKQRLKLNLTNKNENFISRRATQKIKEPPKITTGRQVKYDTVSGSDNLNIKITCQNSQSGIRENNCNYIRLKSFTVVNNTCNNTPNISKKSEVEKTPKLDTVNNNDNCSDVILINDPDDSDVIFVNSHKESVRSQCLKRDDSVILIDDDSIIEVPLNSSSKENGHNVCQSKSSPINWNNIQHQHNQQQGFACSTPARYTINIQPRFASSNNTNDFGSNFFNAGTVRMQGLRPIFIDGSNIAMGHSNGKSFSVEGIKICIDFFKIRGHEVTAVVPQFRKNHGQNSNPGLLKKLEKDGTVIFTPSRRINGKNIVPYDDRYIVLLAHVHKGIIVSSDNYRDLLQENPNLLDTIENRILNPTWLKDMIIFPPDPLGRHGPKLDDFLRFP